MQIQEQLSYLKLANFELEAPPIQIYLGMLTLTSRSLRRKILITDSDTSQCSVLGLSQLAFKFFKLLNLRGLTAGLGPS